MKLGVLPLRLALAAMGILACGRPASPPAKPDPAELRALLSPLSPETLPPAPPDVTNRFADDPHAAALGQKLFFDPGFSGVLIEGDNDGSIHTLGVMRQTGRVSCAGCHVGTAGFLDNRSMGGSGGPAQASLAAGWTLRRTPSLLDVAHSKLLGWDGRRDSTWSQLFSPLENTDEMNSSRLFLAEQLRSTYRGEYELLFGLMPAFDDNTRFPQLSADRAGCTFPMPNQPSTCHGRPGDHAEYDGLSGPDQVAVTQAVVNAGKAVGAYLRKLSCGQSRMDAFVHGDDSAMSAAEQRGAALFTGKANCTSCHSGPFLSDEKFHNVGLHAVTVSVIVNDQNDPGASIGIAALLADPLNSRGRFSDGNDGRLETAAVQQTLGAFRTPKLRCVARRPSFMHTAQIDSLEEVVAFFDAGGHLGGYPGQNELHSLGLVAQERSDLVAFLHALDGSGPSVDLQHAP